MSGKQWEGGEDREESKGGAVLAEPCWPLSGIYSKCSGTAMRIFREVSQGAVCRRICRGRNGNRSEGGTQLLVLGQLGPEVAVAKAQLLGNSESGRGTVVEVATGR